MASERGVNYKDDEFNNDRKADFDIMRKKDNGYGKDLIRNGDQDNGRGQLRVQDNLEYRSNRVIKKDFKERREVSNGGGGNSRTSQNDSGSSSSSSGGLAVRKMDREPGELSSDGSDVAGINSETRVKAEPNGNRLETENLLSAVQNKKRKFSPVVWDRDDRDVNRAFKSRNSSDTTTTDLPSSPSFVKSCHQLPNSKVSKDSKVNISKASPSEVFLLKPDSSECHTETLSLPSNEERLVEYVETGAAADDEDYVPRRTVISSRWASDDGSPTDEGQISEYEDRRNSKKKTGPESAEIRGHRNLISPEIGEVKREVSEGTRGRSSGSDECARSSSSESYHENDVNNDYVELDKEHNYDGASGSHSDMKSEDGDRRSRGAPKPVQQPPQRSVNMLQGCRSVDAFERLNKIDEGTYGVVYRAKDRVTEEIVALKKVKMEKEREGFPLTSLREINILLSFHHPYIIDVKEVVVGSSLDSIFMVMEYMEHDLKALMETMKHPFTQSEVKCLMGQLLKGVEYLHDNWVLHRDLKTSNLLLNNRGELKICDFGLARQYGSPLKPYTHLVVTLWYRAPELLLGAKQYSTAIDMWSLGCIMAELLLKKPLFDGKTEFDQLDKIFKILGTPNETIWPGFSKLPGVKVNFVKHQYNHLRGKFSNPKVFHATASTGSPELSDAGFDLLNKLLTYDPEKRITAKEALNHKWFKEVPLPTSKAFMPTFPAQHAQDRRMRRVAKSPDPLEEQRRKELRQRELGSSGDGGLFGQ